MNWTPGHWRAQGIEIRTSGDSIAYLHGYNVEANARLIAAAPDLYAELSTLVSRVRDALANGGFAADIEQKLLDAAYALAKARGEDR